jgi:hypothetical protein
MALTTNEWPTTFALVSRLRWAEHLQRAESLSARHGMRTPLIRLPQKKAITDAWTLINRTWVIRA